MSLIINLRQLENKEQHVSGTLSIEELDVETYDEVIRLDEPLHYDLVAEKMEKGILVQGKLLFHLQCTCVKCLKVFRYRMELAPWACHLPLEGEDQVRVINDGVDLTPHIREDILLAFPQHPLCEPECKGLPGLSKDAGHGGGSHVNMTTTAWAKLNKLKL